MYLRTPYLVFWSAKSEESGSRVLLAQFEHNSSIEVETQEKWEKHGDEISKPELVGRFVRFVSAELGPCRRVSRRSRTVTVFDYLKMCSIFEVLH